MTLEQFLQNLSALQDAILSVPFTDDSEEYLNQRHHELATLLEVIPRFSDEEQGKAKEATQILANKLSERLAELKKRLSLLQDDVDVVQTRARGMKAYNQGKIF